MCRDDQNLTKNIQKQRGITLIEALITIGFFSLCIAAFFTFVISVQRSHEALVTQTDHILNASRIGMLVKDENVCKGTNIVTENLRVGDPIISPLAEYDKFEISNKGRKFTIFQSGERNGVTFPPLILHASRQALGPNDPHLIATLSMSSQTTSSSERRHNLPIVLTIGNSNRQVISCYANYSLERTCKDLGMKFYYNQTPVCAP